MLSADQVCRPVQVACPGVITQACPQMQNSVEWGGRQVLRRRETLHEALIIGDDGADLRLLQHDFRDPDPIWSGVDLPRQILAPGLLKPCQQPGLQPFGGVAWR